MWGVPRRLLAIEPLTVGALFAHGPTTAVGSIRWIEAATRASFASYRAPPSFTSHLTPGSGKTFKVTPTLGADKATNRIFSTGQTGARALGYDGTFRLLEALNFAVPIRAGVCAGRAPFAGVTAVPRTTLVGFTYLSGRTDTILTGAAWTRTRFGCSPSPVRQSDHAASVASA